MGGGLDLLFPHHENELAQSECATGKRFVRYWLHNGLTRIKTKLRSDEWALQKMSGSIGNVVSIPDMIKEKKAPDLIRYLILSTHYRSPIEFTDDVLTSVQKAYQGFSRLRGRILRLPGAAGVSPEDLSKLARFGGADWEVFIFEYMERSQRFFTMMDDDFNTGGAIGVLHELAGTISNYVASLEGLSLTTRSAVDERRVQAAISALSDLERLGGILGLFKDGIKPLFEPFVGGVRRLNVKTEGDSEAILVEKLMSFAINLRTKAREQKNFALADDIRKGLADIGVTLEDLADGTIWRKG